MELYANLFESGVQMTETLLTVSNLLVTFGGLTAVNNVNITIQEGELVGLIGPNGAGKTTLLNAVVGRNKPSSGQISLGGSDITHEPSYIRARQGLGMSHQIVRPFPGMTPLENVTLAAGLAKTKNPLVALFTTSRSAEEKKAYDLLQLVGIDEVAERDVSELPLGYLKRLEMARAMALEPKFLLLDEPLAGLNQQEAEKLADTIKLINANGQAIILIEHNLREVARIVPRIIVLNNGEVLTEGPTRQGLSDPTVHAVYVGERKTINAST